MKYIIAIGIFHAIAAALLVWRSRARNHADGLLIALLACIGLHLSIKFFIYTIVTDIEVLSMMNTFIGFCYLPLLYLYTIKISRPDFIPASQWYVFVPFIVAAIGFFSVTSVLAISSQAGHGILYWYNTITLWTMIPMDIVLGGWIIYFTGRNFTKDSIQRKLIIQIAALFLTIGVLGFTLVLLKPFGNHYNYASRSVVYTLLILVCIRIITYRYSAFMSPQEEIVPSLHTGNARDQDREGLPVNTDFQFSPTVLPLEENLISNADAVPVYSLLNLTDKRKELLRADEMMSIVLKLEGVMTSEEYYKDSELNLDKLAALTQYKKYHISETLNHFLHKPFYTFVNEYRVQHVKNRLEKLSKKEIEINMLSLAYDAGFNSKSSFNKYFKDIVGQTPSEYFKMISQRVVSLD